MSKVWFITGAGSGIGTGIASMLAVEGVSVVVHGRNEERTKQVAADIESAGNTAARAASRRLAHPAGRAHRG